jgi:hypothetical protein
MISTIEVRHCVHVSERPFDEVVAAFMLATGSVEEGFGSVAAGATTREEFEAAFRAREGSSDFMRFSVIDHGKWLAVMGRPANALMIVLGNPLIAWTMLQHDIAAGLDVPVRMSIHEDPDGRTRVSYDLPSTLMSFIENGDVARAARDLDRKLVALAEVISGVSA